MYLVGLWSISIVNCSTFCILSQIWYCITWLVGRKGKLPLLEYNQLLRLLTMELTCSMWLFSCSDSFLFNYCIFSTVCDSEAPEGHKGLPQSIVLFLITVFITLFSYCMLHRCLGRLWRGYSKALHCIVLFCSKPMKLHVYFKSNMVSYHHQGLP